MRKEKKGEKRNTPLFSPPKKEFFEKKTLYPSEYCLKKLLYFSSSLKPHIKKKPFQRGF
jgi:hypothetical protein